MILFVGTRQVVEKRLASGGVEAVRAIVRGRVRKMEQRDRLLLGIRFILRYERGGQPVGQSCLTAVRFQQTRLFCFSFRPILLVYRNPPQRQNRERLGDRLSLRDLLIVHAGVRRGVDLGGGRLIQQSNA